MSVFLQFHRYSMMIYEYGHIGERLIFINNIHPMFQLEAPQMGPSVPSTWPRGSFEHT